MTLSDRSQHSSNGDDGGARNGKHKYSTDTGYLASVDNQDEGARLSLVSSRVSDVALVGSYRRPSFTYGQSRPSFVPSSPISTAIDALPTSERETMLIQEEELLHDNRFSLGPKDYGTTSRRESHASSSTSRDVPNETTSLLKANSQWESAAEAGAIHTTYLRELIVVTKSALPLWVTFVLQYSLTISSIFAAGNLGKDELAGVSLGSMTATITGYSVYQGQS
jgi:MATE family multidrug resistance protein